MAMCLVLSVIGPGTIAAQGSCTSLSLGPGFFPPGAFIRDLVTFDDGSGPALYTAGLFQITGSASSQVVARWTGSAWTFLSGVNPPSGAWGTALGLVVDSSGPALAVGYRYAVAGSQDRADVIRFGCSQGLGLRLNQPLGAGGGVFVTGANRIPGHVYRNLVSINPCPGAPGSVQAFGLCIDMSLVLPQIMQPVRNLPSWQPVGGNPFHFVAPASSVVFGPYPPFMPPGLLEAVCIDVTSGMIGPVSAVASLTVQ